MRNIRRASGAMASKAKRPGSVIVRGGRRSDASTRAKLSSRAPARARTIVRPSAVAASGAPPITVVGRVQRPGSRSEPMVRPEVTSIRATVVAAPLAVAVYSDRHPTAGWPAGSARGEPAPSARVRSAPARSSTRSPGAVVGAAACSPHPARAKAEAAAARIATEARTVGERMALRLHPSRPGGSRPQSAGPIDSVRSPRSWVVRGAFGAALRFLPHRGKEGGVCRGPGGPLGARGARRGVPSHFARVSQHLPPGARSNVGLAPSGRGRTDVRRRRLRPRALRARTSAR